MAASAGQAFHRFSHGHQDLVLAVDYNFYGTRMVTASSDHKLKVWDRQESSSDSWIVTDVWTAHDAEVTDVKWNGPFVGSILASVAEDGLLRIWQEDLLEPPNSGRRFKKIYEQLSPTRVPYVSLDFKSLATETYLAAISRDGHLTIAEPLDHDDLSDWHILWQDYLCKTPSRTDETGFSVAWHKERLPAWPAVLAGLDRRSLSLAVAVMDTVKIFRTDKDRKFYAAAELAAPVVVGGASTHRRALVRHVAWANGSMRGFDTLATACKDGFIRVYDLHTPGVDPASSAPVAPSASWTAELARAPSGGNKPVRSGIGAGLAGGPRGGRVDDENRPGKVVQEARLVAELSAHDGAVWRVAFSQMGDVLVSTGDDGLVYVWKKDVNLQWTQYAEIDATKQD
ncbi:hypothetical protein ANO11243_006810 [Dothideomycetidae sp. 11243]|nr:hypothetical protein ANO11243_006810 [fungal sp. No.11243]